MGKSSSKLHAGSGGLSRPGSSNEVLDGFFLGSETQTDLFVAGLTSVHRLACVR